VILKMRGVVVPQIPRQVEQHKILAGERSRCLAQRRYPAPLDVLVLDGVPSREGISRPEVRTDYEADD
jgi:hypothetical protein